MVEPVALIEAAVVGMLRGPAGEDTVATLGTFIKAGRMERELAGLGTVLAYVGGDPRGSQA